MRKGDKNSQHSDENTLTYPQIHTIDSVVGIRLPNE